MRWDTFKIPPTRCNKQPKKNRVMGVKERVMKGVVELRILLLLSFLFCVHTNLKNLVKKSGKGVCVW